MMREELLDYYERELSFLRQLGAEFAQKYPKVAGRLLLEPDRCEDPHVERMIEAAAFLASRVHLKIDDEFPELTESLLNVLYPNFLAPIPSLSVVGAYHRPGVPVTVRARRRPAMPLPDVLSRHDLAAGSSRSALRAPDPRRRGGCRDEEHAADRPADARRRPDAGAQGKRLRRVGPAASRVAALLPPG
jgi:hypothetical protein